MATREDVAQLAGVSPSTVSRVLNDSGYVAADVRQRVNKAIKELNYFPNRVARSLRTQKCRQIACIIPSIPNSFYQEIVMGIEETALLNNYTYSLYSMNHEKLEYLKIIFEGFYDGFIFLSPFEIEQFVDLQLVSTRFPISVYADRQRNLSLPHVFVQLREGMQNTVEYLIQQGHQRIAFLGHEFRSPEENPRYQGYMDAMGKHGLEVPEYLCQFIPNYKDTLSYGYDRVKEFTQKGYQFTAIAAANDLLAVGGIRALTELGLRVPEDVSVTGFDDVEIARLTNPALTTVNIPKREIGSALMKILLDQIQGNMPGPETLQFSTSLVVRESVTSIN